MKKTEKKPNSKIENEEVVEDEEEKNAVALTQMALRNHAKSASPSTIAHSFAGMMDDIQTSQEPNREENEGDAVVVMNVALRIRGVSPEEFHQMDEAHRQTAVNAAFLNCDIGKNNVTSNNETNNAKRIDDADVDDDVTDGKNSTDDSASMMSVEGASNAPASSSTNTNAAAAADEDDKEANVESVDENIEGMQWSSDPTALSTDPGASSMTSVEDASNTPASSSTNTNAAADNEDDKEANVESVDANIEGMQSSSDPTALSTDPGASSTTSVEGTSNAPASAKNTNAAAAAADNEDDKEANVASIDENIEVSNVNAISFKPDRKERKERKEDADADANNITWNKMLEDDDDGDDDDDERSVAQQLWDSAVVSAQERISMRSCKANAELGSLIGIENAVAELNNADLDEFSLAGGYGGVGASGSVDRRWDDSKLVAFPPLWIESGAKVRRRFIPDANFAKRLQDWDSEVPKRDSVYSIAIKHNLDKLRRKCYGCINHRDPGYGRCLGYEPKEPEAGAPVWYANVPTPTAPLNIGQRLVPRKQQKDLQQRMAQRRHEPFKYNDLYTRPEFRLNKSVPYYARKPRLPGGGGGGGGGGAHHDDGRRRHAPVAPNRDRGVARGIAKELGAPAAAITGPVDSSRLAELARPKTMNICRNYFPREYMTCFANPRDRRGFKEVELFLPKEEKDKVNRTVDGWPNAKPNNIKDKKKKNVNDDF